MGERVHMVSLGCPKNRVDSEVMAGKLRRAEWSVVDDPAEADVILVNTCSFIQAATEESVNTILELAAFKESGACRKLVVTGCMAQRYAGELEEALPEVDLFVGTGEFHRIDELLARPDAPRTVVGEPTWLQGDEDPRVNSALPHSAWLKISEGCDHRCAFCIIPKLRGKLRSRSLPSLVAEARRLVDQGVVELNLVSQDSTAWGRDLDGGADLGDLVRALAEIDGLRWIRVHYLYPHGVPEAFLDAMAREDKVVEYVDIPLQHVSGPVLKAMRRGVSADEQRRILERIRSRVPDASIRTTFIVGFPGETDRDFERLLAFVGEGWFDHVGVFTYSAEEGTAAAKFPGQVPAEVAEARRDELMRLAARLSAERLAARVGRVEEVLVDGPSPDSELVLAGRLRTQAPDVDGRVYLEFPPEDLRPGDIRQVRITRSGDYDLVGEVVD